MQERGVSWRLGLCLVVGASATAAVLRVDSSAAGGGDGATWADAFRTVGEAMGASVAGDELWVARGVYTEAVSVAAGVAVYGGFRGDEETCDARDWRAHETVIDARGAVSAVVCGAGALLDGVTVTGASQRGVSVEKVSAVIARVTVRGIGVGDTRTHYGVYASVSTVRIEDCVIADNAGYGIYLANSSGEFTIRGCHVLRNVQRTGRCAGIDCIGGTGSVENCVIACNDGDGILTSSCAKLTVRGVTLADNGGAGITAATCSVNAGFTVADSIIWANGGGAIANGVAIPVTFSCIEGAPPPAGEGNIAADPRFAGFEGRGEIFVDPNTAAEGDGSQERPFRTLGAATASFTYALCADSPCVGTGSDGGTMGASLGTMACPAAAVPVIHCAPGVHELGTLGFGLRARIEGDSPETCVMHGLLSGVRSGGGVARVTFAGPGVCVWIGRNQAPALIECRFENAFVESLGTGVTMDRCVVTECAAEYGIKVIEGLLTASASTFVGNAGGGLTVQGYKGEARLQDCVLIENGGGGTGQDPRGGAVYVWSGTLIAERCVFERNLGRANDGGAVALQGGRAEARDCRFTGNRALRWGGAIDAHGATVQVERCEFNGNASGSGGAIHFYESAGDIRATVLRGNVASRAGGALRPVYSSSLACTNVTMCGNAAPMGGAIASYSGSTTTLLNCIAWGNAGGSLNTTEGGTIAAAYSCIESTTVWPGTGNVNVAPRFRGWGDAEVLFLDVGAAPGGDGSQARPFASLDALLDAFAFALCDGSPCFGAGQDGVDMGAGHARATGTPGRPVTIRLAAGVYETGIRSISFDAGLAGAGVDTTIIRGSLWGLNAGRSATDLTVTEGALGGIAAFGDATFARCAFVALPSAGLDTGVTGDKAGVRTLGGNVSMKDCRFADNGVYGVYTEGGACTLENGVFERNGRTAVRSATTDLSITGGSFNGNYVAVSASGNPRVRLRDCVVRGNTMSSIGFQDASDVLCSNITVVENGGNVVCRRSVCTFEHATIARNTPAVGAALFIDACDPTIVNSIVWGNTIAGIASLNGTPAVSFSCVQGAAPWEGTGNIAADPVFAAWGTAGEVFVDPAAAPGGDGSAARPFALLGDAWRGYDYALAASSPCIGMGKDGSTMGADSGTVPEAGAARTVRVAAGTFAGPEFSIGAGMRIEGAGADLTFFEGAVTNLGGDSVLRNVCVRGSTSRGVTIMGGGVPILEDCVITKCDGGVICRAGATPVLRNVAIRDNVLVTDDSLHDTGGGLLCEAGAVVVLEDCDITGNSASYGGGVYCAEAASAAFTNCRIVDNRASYGGGVYCAEAAALRMTDVVVARNGVTSSGAAGLIGAAGALLDGTRLHVVENWSDSGMPSGLGISWRGARLALVDSEVVGNQAEGFSDGSSVSLGGTGAFSLERTRIAHNAGGLRLVDGAVVTGHDVLVRGNLGSGVVLHGPAEVRVEGMTVVENTVAGVLVNADVVATIAGCTIACNGQSDIENHGNIFLEDSIVWNDVLAASIVSSATALRVTYSCVRGEPVVAGRGNINQDPRFAGWGGRTEIFVDPESPPPGDGSRERPFPALGDALAVHSYALCEGSPCLGTGNGGRTMGAPLGIAAGAPGDPDVIVRCASGSYATGIWSLARHVTLLGAGLDATVLGGTLVGLCEGHRLEGLTVRAGLNSGIVVTGARDFVVRDVALRGTQGYYAGGLSCVRATGLIQRCVFSGNEGGNTGGGATVDETSDVAFVECIFDANHGGVGGGGVHVKTGGKGTFDGCTFVANEAGSAGDGPGIAGGALLGGNLDVRDCTFTENAAFGDGGAIAAAHPGKSTIADSRFEGNWAYRGGAVYSTASIKNCEFLSNTAGSQGGACVLDEWVGVVSSVDGCRFIGNGTLDANSQGGAVACTSSKVTLVNCVLAGNAPDAVAARPALAGKFQYAQCAFFANARACSVAAGSRASALNSIFWQNGSGELPVDTVSCLTDIDPRFVRPGVFELGRFRSLTFQGAALLGGTVQAVDFVVDEGDYHLQADSPAVNAGQVEGAPNVDLSGMPRPCGTGVDMGPYEECSGRGRFSRGDANGDGKFDIADAVFTLQYLFAGGAAPSCMDAADVNDDGTPDLSDAVRTLLVLFRHATVPAPYPGCGGDPTEDALAQCAYSLCE